MGDRALIDVVRDATGRATGIGGSVGVASVAGTTVFVKRIPLTDLEAAAGNVGSTANLFALPPACHYGLGSPGMGVWREIAAHAATTQWVLDGRCEGFPLAYHWRILPLVPFPDGPPDELAEVERMVAFWDGSPAVRSRLTAVLGATASVALFCEPIAHPLGPWLGDRVRARRASADAALAMVDAGLRAVVSFLHRQGWVHFDAHVGNLLTDGRTVYLTDFGLVASTGFALDPDERAFVRANRTHDLAYVRTELANWIAREIAGYGDRQDRIAFLRGCADRQDAPGLEGVAASLVRGYAPTAAIMNDFYEALYAQRRTVPYPARALARAGTRAGRVP